jgi:hypothetical protein
MHSTRLIDSSKCGSASDLPSPVAVAAVLQQANERNMMHVHMYTFNIFRW